MSTRKRRISAAVLLTLLLVALSFTLSLSGQTSATVMFDEVHYRAWRFGGDYGINVPMLDRTKFEFMARLVGDTIEPETGRWIDMNGLPDSALKPEVFQVP